MGIDFEEKIHTYHHYKRTMSSESYSGKVDFKVGEDIYQTWYKAVGPLKGGKRPVVAVHGGPGMTHHYMLYDEISLPKLEKY